MTIQLTQASLLDFLKKQGFNPTHQKESNQLCITMEVGEHEAPLFLDVREKGALLQIVTYVPIEMKKEAAPEVSRLLHILNKEMDMPGFCMDEENKLIFFRSILPAFNQELDTECLKLYLATHRFALNSFLGVIAMVATGTKKVDDILKMKG